MLCTLVTFLSVSTIIAQDCTDSICCRDCKFDYCAGNTHYAPSGFQYSCGETCGTAASCPYDVVCYSGYKDKPNKENIPGTTRAACCDQKTCADYDCAAVNMLAASNPTHPAQGQEPVRDDCCTPLTGKCFGNTNPSALVACSTGYKYKADAATISGNDNAACCEPKTCGDLSCASFRKDPKSMPTNPTLGNEPAEADCCEAITDKCHGNTNMPDDVACPAGFVRKPGNPTVTAGDNTNALKRARCCMQPKCIANVAAVACTSVSPAVAAVYGTCNLNMGYTEKPDIATLPADVSVWSNPTAINVAPGSNAADCCIATTGKCSGNTNYAEDVLCDGSLNYKPKANSASISGSSAAACCDEILHNCLSHTQRGVPFACTTGWAFEYDVPVVLAGSECCSAGAGPICPVAGVSNWFTQTKTTSFAASLKAELTALTIGVLFITSW